MNKSVYSPTPSTLLPEFDEEIARFESMSVEEMDAQLRKYGIDPQRTIDEVTRLVQSRHRRWQRPSRTNRPN
jgi:hypothetical protein